MSTNSEPQRIAIGNPEARIIATLSLRLGAQVSLAPSGVLDQSRSRTRRAISRHLSGLVGRVEDAHRIRYPFSERAGPVGHTGMPLMSSLPCARTSSRARLVHNNGVQGNEDLCSLWPALHRTG